MVEICFRQASKIRCPGHGASPFLSLQTELLEFSPKSGHPYVWLVIYEGVFFPSPALNFNMITATT